MHRRVWFDSDGCSLSVIREHSPRKRKLALERQQRDAPRWPISTRRKPEPFHILLAVRRKVKARHMIRWLNDRGGFCTKVESTQGARGRDEDARGASPHQRGIVRRAVGGDEVA